MNSFVNLIGLAVIAFASTNIDDAFVLVGFFADKNLRAHDVVIGQYAGITVLSVIAAIAGLISLVIPPAYIGLLGLAPIGIGVRKLYNLSRNPRIEPPVAGTALHGRRLSVLAVTIANGGDNIAVYTALFASCEGFDLAVIGILFAVMTGLWCLAAHWLVHHRTIGLPIRSHAHRVVPFVLIGLGILIMIRTGTIHLLKH
jgi:cadmium resistance protein CadD (predicted permease)